MARRAQPNRLTWPVTAEGWRRVDDMLQTLFDDSNNGSMTVRTTQLSGVTSVPHGGTGLDSFTVGSVLYASATQTIAGLTAVAAGNALISKGLVTAPSWGKIGLTTHVTGILPAVNGGTGFGAFTIGDLFYADTTATIAKLADIAAGSYLRSGGAATAPLWSTLQLPNASSQGDIFYSTAANAMVVLAKNASATRYLSNTGTTNDPAWAQINLANGTTGVPQALLVEAANETITAGYGAVIPRYRKINSGIKLSILSGAILRIL